MFIPTAAKKKDDKCAFKMRNGSIAIMNRLCSLPGRGVDAFSVSIGFTSSGCVTIPYLEVPRSCDPESREACILNAVKSHRDKLQDDVNKIDEFCAEMLASNSKENHEDHED